MSEGRTSTGASKTAPGEAAVSRRRSHRGLGARPRAPTAFFIPVVSRAAGAAMDGSPSRRTRPPGHAPGHVDSQRNCHKQVTLSYVPMGHSMAGRRALALMGAEVFELLPPTRTVLCVVAGASTTELGVAVTDPYLGAARALPPIALRGGNLPPAAFARREGEIEAMRALAAAAAEHDAGALAFALPMAGDDGARDVDAARYALVRSAAAVDGLPPLLVGIDERLSVADVAARRAEEPDTWADVGGDGASFDAAAALSSFLYAYSGGWHNTFG